MGAQAQELEKEPFELPVINPWQRIRPTQEQIRYAKALCQSELPYAERVATIGTFTVLDIREMSDLIDRLKEIRRARFRRLRRRGRR